MQQQVVVIWVVVWFVTARTLVLLSVLWHHWCIRLSPSAGLCRLSVMHSSFIVTERQTSRVTPHQAVRLLSQTTTPHQAQP
jgi:hypothetical protein